MYYKLIILHLIFALFTNCTHENNVSKKESIPLKAKETIQVNEVKTIYKDSLIIPFRENDTLTYSGAEITAILNCYPELNSKDVSHPDFAYMTSKNKFGYLDSVSKENCHGFFSELGRDAYYILYGYFLNKRYNSAAKFDKPRKGITEIYEIINRVFGRLKRGGTYFGHQYKRIRGYSEYSIYRLNKYEDELAKQYDITKQRELYINLLNQRIEDEIQADKGLGKDEKLEEKKALFELTDKLKTLILDSFYLNETLEFQNSHY
jgi:hypothetical protein